MSNLAMLPQSSELLSEESTAIPSQPNKYQYPEFAGWSGERYLKKLLRQILPMALYRTWEIFADHQAPGNDCYLGVTHLAEIAGRATRTMEKNLASLSAKHLLAERAERKFFRREDGHLLSRVVMIKDFAGLYALAHEYHQWLESEKYIAPDRDLVEFVGQEPRLIEKLRRFDNYRRLFYNRLPGPPPLAREEDRWFTDYYPEQLLNIQENKHVKRATNQESGVFPAKDPQTHLPEDMSNGSVKRKVESSNSDREERVSDDSASPSSKKFSDFGKADNQPGNDSENIRSLATDAPHIIETGESGLAPLATVTDVPAPNHSRTHKLETLIGNAAFCADSHQPGQAKENVPDPQKHLASAKEEEPLSPGQRLATSFLREIALPFGDRSPKGTRTRVLALLREACLDQPTEVLMCLFRAYVVARDTSTIRPEHCHPETGQENRIPLFCAMVQRFAEECRQGIWLGISRQQMAEEIATDACLAGWWNEHHLLAGIPDKVVPDNRAEDQVLQTQRMVSHFERRKRLSQTDEQREKRVAYAHRVLQCLSKMAVPIYGAVVLWEHLTCGCPVYYQRNGREVCARCSPDPTWSENALRLIHSIVEQNGAEDTGSEATEDILRCVPDTIEILAKEEQQPYAYEEAASGWIEREEAYACAVHLLDELASNGYAVEVYLHLAGERYQVIVKGADGELICETTEQIGYLIEQGQKGLL